jgi:4-carboxymuconolactone decarboxylase
MSRIQLIARKSDIDPSRHAEFDAICEVLHAVPAPFGALMHSPGLAEKVMGAGAHIRLKSTLAKAEREIAILAVAREKDASFEWAAHSKAAREAGVAEKVISAIRDWGDLTDVGEDARDIVSFVQQIIRTNRVSDGLFDRLRARHSIRWLVELAGTVGQYLYISTVTGVFEIEAPDSAELLAAAQPVAE